MDIQPEMEPYHNIVGEYYYFNGEFIPTSKIAIYNIKNDLMAYEVIRVINSVPLFLEMHLMRLSNSIDFIGSLPPDLHVVKEKLLKLIKLNGIINCNLRVSVSLKMGDRSSSDTMIYLIQGRYPSLDELNNGVNVRTIMAQRAEPNAKIENSQLRDYADQVINRNKCYEVVLVNRNGMITEGSRSNIFFIKQDRISTAPLKLVLGGITRQIVVDLCKRESFQLNEAEIPIISLSEFESAFLTGTSPGLLPINRIDDQLLSIKNPLLDRLTELYRKEVENYISNFHF